MNPYAKFLMGGAALLATTALTSVVTSTSASAASITDGTTALSSGNLPAAFKAVKIVNNVVGGATGSATALGPLAFSITTSASTPYTQSTSILLNFTGANITGTPTLSMASFASGGSITGASSGTGVTATMFSDHILISTTSGSSQGTWSVIQVNGVSFNNAQSLATVGNSIAVSGSVTVSGIGQTESISSTNLVTSVAGPTVTVTPLSTVQAASSTTPPFVNFGSSSQLTAEVGVISISSATGVSLALNGAMSTSNLVTTAEVKVTHPALANAAVASVRVGNPAGAVTTLLSHSTVAELAGGSITFTVPKNSFDENTNNLTVAIVFNGTTQITGGKGGTATVTFAGGGDNGTKYSAIAAATGNLGDVTLNGLSADVNTAQSSANAFPSYIRIHNTSATAGVATIVVKNDGTGATIGTYTTASIPAGATLQVGTGQIETALSITPSATTPYELQITGAFTGYVQHLGFDGKSLIDLDGFRAASNP